MRGVIYPSDEVVTDGRGHTFSLQESNSAVELTRLGIQISCRLKTVRSKLDACNFSECHAVPARERQNRLVS